MTLYTSGDWTVDPNKRCHISISEIGWIKLLPVIKDKEIEINPVDLDGRSLR